MKKITAKVGEYQKDGQAKGRYVDIGVINSNDNGEYIILNPEVSLSGILAKQNAHNLAMGKQARDNVICSIFDNNNQGQQTPMQQPAQQQNQTAPTTDFDDDIPF